MAPAIDLEDNTYHCVTYATYMISSGNIKSKSTFEHTVDILSRVISFFLTRMIMMMIEILSKMEAKENLNSS